MPVAYVVNREQVTYQLLDDLIRQLIGKEADYSRIVARLAGRYGKRSLKTRNNERKYHNGETFRAKEPIFI